MIPVPIPDHCVPPGCERIVIGPADGDPTGDVRAVEAVVGIDEATREMRIAVLVELEPGELERLHRTPGIWLTFRTNQISPFSLHVADAEEWPAATDPDLQE
jgi:hypothetical protein